MNFLRSHDPPAFLYSFPRVNRLSITLTTSTRTTTAKMRTLTCLYNKQKTGAYQNDSTQEKENLYLSSLFRLILFLRWHPFLSRSVYVCT